MARKTRTVAMETDSRTRKVAMETDSRTRRLGTKTDKKSRTVDMETDKKTGKKSNPYETLGLDALWGGNCTNAILH
jgi:hypothetical protein